MMERARKVVQGIDRLTLRERLAVFAAAVVVLSGAWEALLAGPLEARERIADEKLTSLQQRLGQLNESIAIAAEGMTEGMPGQLDRLQALRARVAEGEDNVRALAAELVDPVEMRRVLEDLLGRQVGLRLVSATNLEARPLFDEHADEHADAEQQPAAGTPSSAAPKLYRHTLVLHVQGSYLDCLAYLQAIERLPWHLYWARLELHVGEYPQNDIVIEVHTLSLDEEWIGV
jgi:MSHA biogenesis protein MshJ